MDTLELLQLTAKDVMSTDLKSVNEEALMLEVNQLFNNNQIHHVPVVDNEGRLAGIISKSDLQLLKDWGTRLKLDNAERKNSFMLRTQLARDVMNKKVVSVRPNDTLEFCVDILKENYFHSLPVTDSGKLIGMLTTYDLINIAYTKTPLIN